MKFEVGDKVKAFGCEGEVIEILNYPLLTTYPIICRFPDVCGKLSFSNCGKLENWHKEPSLFLVEKARKYVEFKDWEELAPYRTDGSGMFYTKRNGLPGFFVSHCVAPIPFDKCVSFFTENKFYEVRDGE